MYVPATPLTLASRLWLCNGSRPKYLPFDDNLERRQEVSGQSTTYTHAWSSRLLWKLPVLSLSV